MKNITNITNKLLQALADFVFGIAIYFGLQTFVPGLGNNVIVIITLVITALFAEFVELKWKK